MGRGGGTYHLPYSAALIKGDSSFVGDVLDFGDHPVESAHILTLVAEKISTEK